MVIMFSCVGSGERDDGLKGYWPLSASSLDIISATALDISGNDNHAFIEGSLDLKDSNTDGNRFDAVSFNGNSNFLEVPPEKISPAGEKEFSISVWVESNSGTGDVPGDIISQYDPVHHKGFHLGIKSNAVTTSQANYRTVQFGIDNDIMQDWSDRGRPGNAVCAFSLASSGGHLYAGTCEAGKNEAGHVYRYEGPGNWTDCGSPDSSNSVMSLAEFNGKLYAGTGKYRLAGSSLTESENQHIGGSIFRYEGGKKWISCGHLPETEAIGGMIVYRGALYASSLYRPAGFYRYDQEKGWISCGTPDGKRVVALGVYNGYIYATSYDGGYVYRFDGTSWTNCGQLGNNTQTYSFAVFYGRLYVGTWPSGRVYLFGDKDQWTDMGRLGNELEVMGMLVHNGRLMAGTLPLAEVYTYEGDTVWKKITRLDHTPDVRYRRAWTMAEHDGKVFCSTLPSGKIFSTSAGYNVMSASSLPDGWHHIAAVRTERHLILYIDGKESGRTDLPRDFSVEMSDNIPLRIGYGSNDFFSGRMADLKIYNRPLDKHEIRSLSDPRNMTIINKQSKK